MSLYQAILFTISWISAVYLLNCLIARKFRKVELSLALVYFATVGMIGVFGEATLGTIYNAVVGHPFWTYNIFPVHHGYTSKATFFIWGIYGFYVYLFHGHFNRNKTKTILQLSLIFALESLIVEGTVNLTYLLATGSLMYYYYPADLWHLTSVQTLPFWFLAGYVIVKTLKRFETDPRFFIKMCTVLALSMALLG